MKLALFTFGIFIKPADDPANDEFHNRNDPILAELDAGVPGFLGRSGYEDEDGPLEWGSFVLPHWYVEMGDGWSPATLSLWEDAEAVAAFAYTGLHGQAVKRGNLWFQTGEWPPYVMWWVMDDHRPDWAEGVARHKALFESGPSASGFNMAHPFSAEGQPASLDGTLVMRYRAASG